ncbi:phenylalanine--tRNA ligase beta subunit [Rhizocola hellebori]|uniref:phenylalanine--tRNA ligase n=1 Tax=Rhizocola hellebori TaxID=1392758 RepID=A0A8J3VJX1_9ACTN|nr:phenylalanine--tRNA ligase subunit beta [Rhizocola hellebori]GIH08501.1 phenylalanine--tRNA ligase beta subunit [Rhizocola hellebori]
MKLSLEWISEFVDLPAGVPATELAHQLTLKTVEVEDVVDVSAGLANVVVGRIVAVASASGGGSQVTCDLGGQSVNVTTVLSGVAAGRFVAVAVSVAPGGEVELCSAAGLRLHQLFPRSAAGEVLDLTDLNPPAGARLAEVIGFDDVVLEVDNKSLTNRPDLWGHYGVAREFAAIYGLPLRALPCAARPPAGQGLVGQLEPQLCQRFAAVRFSADNSGEAPLWLRSRLARIGENSINPLVDLSNYVMFTVGQPNHVYDAERVTLPLRVLATTAATKADLLTGPTQLPAGLPVVRDQHAVVGVAGVIGAAESSVISTSRQMILEVATFRAQPVRSASQQLGIRTEASARYEKGLDTDRVDAAVGLYLALLEKQVPGVTVEGIDDVIVEATQPARVQVGLDFLSSRIGEDVDAAKTQTVLQSLGFAVIAQDGKLAVTAPSWRSTGDISLPHDIVEEIARIRGYDDLPVAALTVALRPVRQLHQRPLDRVLRELLATRAGMQEVVTYPWAADQYLAAAGQDGLPLIRFEGAPSPDRGNLRPTLLPTLLEAIVGNLRYHDSFALFEVGTVFRAGQDEPYKGHFEVLPRQDKQLGMCQVGGDGAALFRRAKGTVEMLNRYGHLVGIGFGESPWPAWTDTVARLGITVDDQTAGIIGLVNKRCLRAAGIDGGVHVAYAEIDIGKLVSHPSRHNTYVPIADLPEADFDLSVVVAERIAWAELESVVAQSHPLVHRVEFVDEFRGSWVPAGHRSVSLRVTLRPRGSTLTAEVIGAARTASLAALETQTGAVLRQ